MAVALTTPGVYVNELNALSLSISAAATAVPLFTFKPFSPWDISLPFMPDLAQGNEIGVDVQKEIASFKEDLKKQKDAITKDTVKASTAEGKKFLALDEQWTANALTLLECLWNSGDIPSLNDPATNMLADNILNPDGLTYFKTDSWMDYLDNISPYLLPVKKALSYSLSFEKGVMKKDEFEKTRKTYQSVLEGLGYYAIQHYFLNGGGTCHVALFTSASPEKAKAVQAKDYAPLTSYVHEHPDITLLCPVTAFDTDIINQVMGDPAPRVFSLVAARVQKNKLETPSLTAATQAAAYYPWVNLRVPFLEGISAADFRFRALKPHQLSSVTVAPKSEGQFFAADTPATAEELATAARTTKEQWDQAVKDAEPQQEALKKANQAVKDTTKKLTEANAAVETAKTTLEKTEVGPAKTQASSQLETLKKAAETAQKNAQDAATEAGKAESTAKTAADKVKTTKAAAEAAASASEANPVVSTVKSGTAKVEPGGNTVTDSDKYELIPYGQLNETARKAVDDLLKQPQAPLSLSPIPAVAGAVCRTDNNRGVWKAPANIPLTGVDGLCDSNGITVLVGDVMNTDLVNKKINAIRIFTPRQGALIWGARTLAPASSDEWRYIPVRRLFNSAETDIEEAMQAAVFEPNVPATWEVVRSAIDNYLHRLWQHGALFGATPAEAYFVHVGANITMTPQDISDGKLIVRVGLAAVRPAEFVILEFSQKQM